MHFDLYMPLYDHLDYNENNIVWTNCMAVSLKEEPNGVIQKLITF